MSRTYEVEVVISPCPSADAPSVTDTLARWGLDIDSDMEAVDDNHPGGWCFWGVVQIAGGGTEHDRHQELQVLLPDHALTTRWRWIDELPWDEVFITEPLQPSAP